MAQARITVTGSDIDPQSIDNELRARGLDGDIRIVGSGSIRSISGDALSYVSLVADIGKDLVLGVVASYIYDSLKRSREVKLNGAGLSPDTSSEQIEEQLHSVTADPTTGTEPDSKKSGAADR